MKLPFDYENRMKELLGDDFEAFLSAMSHESVRALRVNTLKGSVENFININPWGLCDKDKVDWCPTGFYIDDQISGKHPLHQAGVFYIQESSAMSVVEKLNVEPGDFVLDLCASPGGKSTQIGAYLKGNGLLVSNEPILERASNLSENIERAGIPNCLVCSAYPDEISERFEGAFNKILVDAPCSGEGMFRKNPDAVGEWSVENVLMCAQRQKDILTEAYKMLAPGGRLVYSTCTFSREEDEENAAWFTDTYDDMHLVEQRKLLPYEVRGEGHFYAVFDKLGEWDEHCSFKKEAGINPKQKDIVLADYYDFEKEYLNITGTDIFGRNGKYILFGDELYLIPESIPQMKGLKVLRSGLCLGTLKKNRFEPSHGLAMYLKPEDAKASVSLTQEDATRFLKGESLSGEFKRGWNLVCYEGYSLGWGKASNGMLKNHYPKGLRIN